MSGPVPLAKAPVSVNACIYGEPGAGKTILAASSPNCLILDADFGTESAQMHFPKDTNVQVWSCPDFIELSEAFTYVRNEDHDFEWVWLDSGSLFQERALHDEIMMNAVEKNPNRNEYVPDVREYLIVQNQLAKFIRHFCGLPINFGFTAYPAAFDLGEKQTIIMPMLQGKQGEYSQKICGYLNFIGSLGISQEAANEGKFENRLLTRRQGRYYAKNRFGLPTVIDNPDMTEISKMINEAQEA